MSRIPRHFNNEAGHASRMVPKLIQLRSRHPGQLRHKPPFFSQASNSSTVKAPKKNGYAKLADINEVFSQLDPIELEIAAINVIEELTRHELLDRDYQKG